MRRIRITITTVWTVPEEDSEIADMALKEQPKDVACDYIEDAWNDDKNMEVPTVKWEQLED